VDTNQCCGCEEYHVRDRRTWPVEPPVEKKWKRNGAGYSKAVRVTASSARGNVPDGRPSQPPRERADYPGHEAKRSISTKTRKRELAHETSRARRQ
jgi:hypothetical protein